MNQSRRDFISTAASAVALSGCSSLGLAAKKPEPSFVWSYLVHFGYNSWIDAPIEKQDKTKIKPSLIDDYCAGHVRFSETSWRRLSDALAKAGCNQIVIDLAEIVQYPSHPELAVKGSWSVEKLRAELDRLRGIGFEVIPKMNFSATHCSKERIKGYMMAPWLATLEKYEAKSLEAIAQMEPVIKARKA